MRHEGPLGSFREDRQAIGNEVVFDKADRHRWSRMTPEERCREFAEVQKRVWGAANALISVLPYHE
jgi:hypothetical protein